MQARCLGEAVLLASRGGSDEQDDDCRSDFYWVRGGSLVANWLEKSD